MAKSELSFTLPISCPTLMCGGSQFNINMLSTVFRCTEAINGIAVDHCQLQALPSTPMHLSRSTQHKCVYNLAKCQTEFSRAIMST